MAKPKNVILVVADSLRYDSVYRGDGPGVPYLEQHGIQFTGARSSGCWTLPATSSMFSGLLPHQHGAHSQNRWLNDKVPTLPGLLESAGYRSIQVTANMVTTDIFNVSKGFSETYKTWNITHSKHNWLLQTVLALNRPRIRRMVLKPKDLVFEKLSEDLRQGIIWAQKTSHDAFAKAKERIAEHNAKGQGVFMFVNLMESHYPYHIADTFTLMNKTLAGKIHEWQVLYHFLSQSFIKRDNSFIKPADLDLLRRKQQLAWKLIRNDINNFCQEMHQGQDNLVIFCSDHGDNFGEQGWQYHFGNVTEGGNKVPVFWLDHEAPRAETKTHNVSARFMFNDILRACGIDNAGENTLMQEQAGNLPFLESFWYDNEGHTMPKYKYNQMAFVEGDKRFVLRAGNWMYAPVPTTGREPVFEFMDKNFNPLQEVPLDGERKKYLEQSVKDFSVYSEKVMNRGKK